MSAAETFPFLSTGTDDAWTATPEPATVDPGSGTPVLQNRELRPLRPGTDTSRLSRFGDDMWDLTPAVLRESTGSVFVTFAPTPRGKLHADGISAPYREAVKRFAWALINAASPDSVLDRGANSRQVIAVTSIKSTIQYVRYFTQFLDAHGTPPLDQVDKALFLAYLDHVAGGTQDPHNKRRRLAAVERLAHTAPLLPASDRLPHPAWDDQLIADTIGRSTQTGENRFPSIKPQTMSWILEWSQRFVDRYATDILAARTAAPHAPTVTTTAGDHRPWLTAIDAEQAGELTEVLVAACFVTIAYLSGMRPAEVLNLQTGCVTRIDTGNPAAPHRRYEITGTEFKGVTNPDGSLDTAGRQRPDRWIVIEPVARAVAILEGLAPGRHLFPFESFQKPLPRRGPAGDTRTVHRINRNVARLIDWVNTYCATHDLDDQAIPADPHGPVHAARFRRTIAWFIARRPGGHLGLGYQYGHLDTATSAGYSRRSNDLGDLIDMEQLLATVDSITTIGDRLNHGEQLHGPAADRVHHAVTALHTDHHYTGAFTTQAQLGRMRRDPRLRIYEHPDRMLICAYNPDTAACRAAGHPAATPDRTNCQPHCHNIARTTTDLADLGTEISRLHDEATEPLTPEPLAERLQQRADTLKVILDTFQASP